MVKKVKDEVGTLLAEIEIGRFKIKPWSFGRFKKVYPALLPIIPVLKSMGFTAENTEEVLASKGLEVIGAILPAFSGLIAATLDISEEEADALEFSEAAAIGLTIVAQNIGRLKNSLPLLMDQIKAVTRGI